MQKPPYIIYSNMALELYEMLGIRKEKIEAGQPWQNYAETLFSIQKRLADHDFSNARTWAEIQQAHRKWWINYNQEHHLTHQKRQDGCHSPQAVLCGVLDGPTRKRCSPACCMPRSLPVIWTGMATSGSRNGASLAKTVSRLRGFRLDVRGNAQD